MSVVVMPFLSAFFLTSTISGATHVADKIETTPLSPKKVVSSVLTRPRDFTPPFFAPSRRAHMCLACRIILTIFHGRVELTALFTHDFSGTYRCLAPIVVLGAFESFA